MTGRPAAVPPPEAYVDGRKLAELMGVSRTTVKRWTAEGMPSETWGMRIRRYLPSRAMAWAQARDPVTLNGSRDREGNAPGKRQQEE
jgi:phage terminase Nu1 subunit (DNA packaging protein)